MADLAKLQIRVDSRQVKTATRDLDRLSRESEKTTRSTDKVTRAFGGLGRAATAAFAAIGVTQIARVVDEFTLLEARLQNATRSTKEFDLAFNGLLKSSAEAGVSFGAAVDVFQRLSFSRDEINATVDEMVSFTDTVSKLGVVSGASTGALQAGLTQLGQGLSAGILRAEEFNSILENIPAVGVAIANEFGVSVGQLRALVLEGEVLSEDVFTAILNQSQRVNEEFEKFPKTIGRATNELVQKSSQFAVNLLETVGITQLLTNLIDGMASLFEKLNIGLDVFKLGFRALLNDLSVFFRDFYFQNIDPVLQAIDEITGSATADKFARFFANTYRRDFSSEAQGIEDRLLAIDGGGGVASQDGQPVTRQLSKNYEDLAVSAEKASEATEKVKESTSDLERALDRFGASAAQTFTDFISGATSAREAIGQLLDDIAKLVLQQTVTNPIASFISGSIGNVFGSAFGGGGSLGQTTVAALPTNFATGGSFMVRGNTGIDTNRLSINGSPVANVSKGETVSIGKRGSNGGQQVVYNIDARGADAGVEQRVLSALAQVNQSIERRSVSAVQNARFRDPALFGGRA